MHAILLSGSKLHCHLQLLHCHFLPFCQQRRDLGYAICLFIRALFSKSSSVTLIFTAFYSYDISALHFFPPHIYSKLLGNVSHFHLLQLATLLSTNFSFCLKYFFLPLESLSKFYTSIFNVMSIFTPFFITFGFSLHFLKRAPPYMTISLKNDQNATSSKNPSSLISDYFLNLTNTFNKTKLKKKNHRILCDLRIVFELSRRIRDTQLYSLSQHL